MDQKSDYAKDQECRHRRKIVLPCVIPWEYGSNKFASQKGMGGFSSIRNTTLKIQCSKQLIESNNAVMPQITGSLPHREGTTQSGETSFGSIRGQITRECQQKVPIHKIVNNKISETLLNKWAQPNKDATNSDIGKSRNAVHKSSGGRQFTQEEMNKSRAAIPRFQNPRPIMVEMSKKNKTESTLSQEADGKPVNTNPYLAWMGGQVTLQSNIGKSAENQSILSKSYYNYLMTSRQIDSEAIRKKLELHKHHDQES